MKDEALTRKLANLEKSWLMDEGDAMLLELASKSEIQKWVKGHFEIDTDEEPQRTLYKHAISQIDWPLFWEVFGLDRFGERAKKLYQAYLRDTQRTEALQTARDRW